MVEQILREQAACRIVDIGGLPNYWRCFAPDIVNDSRVTITIVNLAYDKDPTRIIERQRKAMFFDRDRRRQKARCFR